MSVTLHQASRRVEDLQRQAWKLRGEGYWIGAAATARTAIEVAMKSAGPPLRRTCLSAMAQELRQLGVISGPLRQLIRRTSDRLSQATHGADVDDARVVKLLEDTDRVLSDLAVELGRVAV